jgi:hypothetical protein
MTRVAAVSSQHRGLLRLLLGFAEGEGFRLPAGHSFAQAALRQE